MADEKPKARVTDVKRVFNGFFKVDEYHVDVDNHEGGGSRQLKRLVFERGHAVAILGYDPARDEVLLVSEMRIGILAAGEDPFAEALPAGMIDAGETAIDAAKREMVEETGMTLNNPTLVHAGAYVSPGGTSERIALVCGTVDMTQAGGVHGHASEGEDIKTIVVSADEFIRRAEAGTLKDMKSLMAAFWLAIHRSELRTLASGNQPPQKGKKTDGPGL